MTTPIDPRTISDESPVTIQNCLGYIAFVWNELQAFLAALSDEQTEQRTDAAGWAVKDHVAHLAAWENGIAALLEGESRTQAMGITEADWNLGDDGINDIIFRQHREKNGEQAKAYLNHVHARLLANLERLNDADLLRPYNSFDAASSSTGPIIEQIAGNTFGHYAEHLPWMRAIAQG
jgi:uncharacterized protein (TIGR03083 family)